MSEGNALAERICAPELEGLNGIAHGFFTRNGGVSTGIYASLNCGVGSADDQSAVAENRARVAAALGVSRDGLATPYQVHGRDVALVDDDWTERPRADAVVSDRAGVAIAVGTADCGPILLADAQARVVGAAHAGWRGALAGVAEAAIEAMERRGAERGRIVAILGPTITQANYEVGDDLRTEVLATDPSAEPHFIAGRRVGHHQFDLPGYIVARLTRAGVGTAGWVGRCTYAEPDRFVSYRRATHDGEPDYGRMLAGIALC